MIQRQNKHKPGADQAGLVISSRNNPTVKAIRSLDSRKERERSGLFFAQGLQLVAAAVQQGAEIETCVVGPDLLISSFGRQLAQAQRERGVAYVEVTSEVFQSIATKDRTQGIGVVVRQRWEALKHIRPAAQQCWVALDTVQYPGNLGAILRTSDAVGGAGVILLGNTTDPYDPAAVRASAGAIFSQRLVRASFEEFAAWKRRHGAMVVGTAPVAPLDYQSIAYRSPLVLLMGSEPRGLSPDQQALCDAVVTIPMVGHGDSLNLAVATGIVLYEIFNQRRGDRI